MGLSTGCALPARMPAEGKLKADCFARCTPLATQPAVNARHFPAADSLPPYALNMPTMRLIPKLHAQPSAGKRFRGNL
ncbi:hypothetical protein NCCP1664_06100 [Zafaria cholistanensis]|uniref:Uncharacterized protein n=1 Tax=Zafaria cholistanensis TaxID=1682741 RepID=A0A5A7NMD2_9MICC|nr:hypothetical protein NCCP1664_06100 [Zafaria cholistanensis]